MVRNHVHLQPEKCDALGLEMHALLKAMLTRQQNRSSRTDNAVPWKSFALCVQRPRHLTRRTRIACRVSNISVRGNFASRNPAHLPQHVGKHAGFRRSYLCAFGFHFSVPMIFLVFDLVCAPFV
jgi:hypothetical protein